MPHWAEGARRQAMLRAAVFRLFSDEPVPADGNAPAYARVLAPLLG
jgi:hypothetical protein